MAYIKTDDTHYTNAAEAIRAKTGTATTYKPSELPVGIDEVYKAGEAFAAAACAAKHYTQVKEGSGTSTMRFDCPFAPDSVLIYTWSPFFISKDNTVNLWAVDLRSFGRYGGMFKYRTDTNLFSHVTNATLADYVVYENGTIALISPDAISEVLFDAGMQFVFVAVKYTDKTDWQLLKEEIARLSATGDDVVYSEKRVYEALASEGLTETDWETLISTKPDRTIILV